MKLILLILAIIVTVFGGTCPPEQVLKPCKCNKVSYNKKSLKNYYKYIFEYYYRFLMKLNAFLYLFITYQKCLIWLVRI